MLFVIGDVSIKFFLPPFGSCFWGGAAVASCMPVPEAAVDKDDGVIFRQNDVGFTGQVFAVPAEAVAGAVEHGADEQFVFRVFTFYRPHIFTALFWSQTVHAGKLTTKNTKIVSRKAAESF